MTIPVDMTPSEIVLSYADQTPVDLAGLARDLGIAVVQTRNGFADESGKIERTGTSQSGFQITINSNHSERRRRFTLAHEIGHFMLHRGRIGDGITDNAMYRSTLGDAYEREANQYAAGLLMPARAIRRLWSEGIHSEAEIADRFNVSVDAAKIRIKELKLA